MHTYIPSYLRSKNRGVVVQLFIQHKLLSKADIAKQSGLTFPAVTNVISDFILLHEVSDCIDYSLQADSSTPEEYEVISRHMTDAADTLLQAHPKTHVLGVGIGMPGVADAKNSTFRRWRRFCEMLRIFPFHWDRHRRRSHY